MKKLLMIAVLGISSVAGWPAGWSAQADPDSNMPITCAKHPEIPACQIQNNCRTCNCCA